MADFAIVTEIFYSGAWHNISGDVRNRDPVSIERGARDESANVRPGRLTFTLNNGRSNVNGAVVGRYTPRNPRSDLFGLIGRNTPVRQSIQGHRRFTGEISEWPTRWDLAATEIWIGVQAYGILRRLGQGGGKPIVAAPKRRLLAVGADAYWPLDAGELAGQVGEPAFGSHRFELAQGVPQFGRAELAAWAGPGLTLRVETTASGMVEQPASGIAQWTAEMFCRFSEGPATTNDQDSAVQTEWILHGNGTPAWEWRIQTNSLNFLGTGPTLTLVFDDTSVGGAGVVEIIATTGPVLGGPNLADGLLHHVLLTVTDEGAVVNATVTVDNVVVLDEDYTTATSLQGVGLSEFHYRPDAPTEIDDLPALTIGHVAHRHSVAGALASTAFAGVGYFGEAAGRRIERLCAEEAIPFASEGNLDATELLGQQQIGPILTLFDQAADADGGILYEDRQVAGLIYATLGSLYNRAPVLELDYRSGHISPPFDPTDDDQQLVNDATAKRIDGGDRRVVKATGPLSIEAPPVGVGRYDRSYEVNVTDDDRLTQHAAYRVAFGTFDESRFPEVGFRVLKHPELVADFVALDSGDWITVANPPPWLPPEQIGCLVRGYRERYSRSDWTAELWTIPSGLYTVGVLDVDRLDSAAATVNTAFIAGVGTSLSVAYNVGAALAATGVVSFDIRAAGVVLHVTNIAGASSPQTFTVDQAPLNGVAKTIPTGTPVDLASQWRLAL